MFASNQHHQKLTIRLLNVPQRMRWRHACRAFLIHYIIPVRVVEKIRRTTSLIWGVILGSYAKRTLLTIGASNAQFGSTCGLHKLCDFPAWRKVHRLRPKPSIPAPAWARTFFKNCRACWYRAVLADIVRESTSFYGNMLCCISGVLVKDVFYEHCFLLYLL